MVYVDLETYSAAPLKLVGAHKYAADPTFRVLLVAFAVDDGPVHVVDVSEFAEATRWPAMLHKLREVPSLWVAHNAMFDRVCLNAAGFPIPLTQWRCSMARAFEHALPGALEQLAPLLRVPTEALKIVDGKRLVRTFCVPDSKGRRRRAQDHPEEWKLFCDYARRDVEALREVWQRLPLWNHDPEAWHLDQRMNDRGFGVDVEFVDAMMSLITQEQKRADLVMRERTGGVGAMQRDKLLEYLLAEHGVYAEDLRSSTINALLQDPEIPENVRWVLNQRSQAARVSTAKYRAFLRGTLHGRFRGGLQYCGAQRTRRWSGRRVQPQNFPRPTMSWPQIQEAVRDVKLGIADVTLPSIMEAGANLIRPVIVPRSGATLAVADLSAIEGRGGAWLCGEEWKVQAFADYDAGRGEDMYKVSYGRSFNRDPATIGKGPERQIGKVQELEMQYQGGVGAFVTFAAVYNIDLATLPSLVFPNSDGEVRLEAEAFYERSTDDPNRSTYGLERDVFVACDILKRLWRARHPAITATWFALEDAMRQRIVEAGPPIPVGRMRVARRGSWLVIELPSGRCLCYPGARVANDGKLSYFGRRPMSNAWAVIDTYGGKLLENATQSFCYDILRTGVQRAESRGFDPVLTVHDEIVAEWTGPPEEGGPLLAQIMAEPIDWAPGFPLAAVGHSMTRYHKED